MTKKKIFAFVILILTALILVFNTMGDRIVQVNLIFNQIEMVQSLAFLGFIVIGVIIGIFLR